MTVYFADLPARLKRSARARITAARRYGVTISCLFVTTALFSAAPKANSPLADAPVAYFNAKCARCHGQYGSFYGEEFGRRLTDRQLNQVVADMAAGPSQAPLSGRALDAQVAFHRALIAHQPFLAWTGINANAAWGEVTPGARVSATVNGRQAEVEVSRTGWKVPLPGNGKALAIRLSAAAGKTSVTLDLGRASFTHGAPLAR